MSQAPHAHAASAPLPAAPGSAWRALREYFRYHGVLTPGVRLMRSINVLAKVLLVSLAFIAPLLVTGVFYGRSLYTSYGAIQAELRGARYTVAVAELTMALQRARQAAVVPLLSQGQADLATPLAALDGRWREVVALDERWGRELGTTARLQALGALHAQLIKLGAAGPTTAAQRALWSDYMKALAALREAALDGAGVSLESNGRDYHLMQVSLITLPEAAEALFGYAVEGSVALSEPTRDPADLVWLGTRAGVADKMLTGADMHMHRLARQDEQLAQQLSLDSLQQQVRAYIYAMDRALAQAQPTQDPSHLLAEGMSLLSGIWAAQARAETAFEAGLIQRKAALEEQARIALVASAVGLALAIYLLVAMHNVLRGGMNLLRSYVDRMAQGDLSAPSKGRGRDEVADALSSLRESLMRLADLFTVVRQNVHGVSHAAAKIAMGNASLSERTARAREAIGQIHIGMETLGGKLDSSGQVVNDALPRVKTMRAHTTRSTKSVRRLHERMSALQSRSREITEIVDLIEGLAAQTKILALNASVEAARVGEAGKGFAVVAMEVRALAQRSANAAEQINTILSASIEDIEQSHRLAERVASSVQSTDDCAATVDASMNEIVELVSHGQEHAREVRSALHQVRSVTDENAELVEQLSAAAGLLREQGAQLNEEVDVFKLV